MYAKVLITMCMAMLIKNAVLQDDDNYDHDFFERFFGDTLPPVNPTPTKDPECFIGRKFFNGTHVTLDNQTSTVCLAHEKTCQTKVEMGPNKTYRIFRQCKTPGVCENNQKNNDQVCYSKTAELKKERLCYFCCQGDFCNNGKEINITLPEDMEEDQN